MKQTMRIWLALVLAFYAGTTAWAIRSYTYTLAGGTLENCGLDFSGDNVSGGTAEAGTPVTITVIPYNGYATKGITIKTYMNTGDMQARNRSQIIEEITPQSTEDPNVFIITMPAANVIVNATTTRVVQDDWILILENQPEQTTYTGSPLEPAIAVMDGETELRPGTDYDVSYSNNINAALSNAENAPTVTITGKGNYSGTASKTFTIEKATPVISDQPEADVITYGQELGESGWLTQPQAINPISMLQVSGSYDWSNPNIVPSVSDSQNTEYEVTFTPFDVNNYKTATTKIKVIVNPADIHVCTLMLSEQTFTYNGSDQTPDVIVTLGETTLEADKDYTVSYRNNKDAALSDAGENAPTVTVTGIDNYSGEITQTFTISPKSLDNFSINDIPDQTYSGSELEPEITLMDGETTLEADKDYTVSYSNNKDAAQSDAGENAPTVTVTGQGNYEGTLTKTFTINKAPATISYTTTEVSTDFGDDAFTNVLTNTGDGTVAYAVTAETSDEGCTTVATINDATGEVTITGTGSATITATVADNDNYTYGGTNTATYTLTVTKGTINASATGGSYSYSATGSHAITVSVTKPSSDYTIMYGTTDGSYELTTNPSYSTIGTYTTYYKVSAPNYNDFTGQATVTVNAASLTGATVTLSQTSYDYDGTAKEPAVSAVTLNGTELASSDYTVSYSDNVNAGTATVTVIGRGNYTGTASQTFTINSVSTTDENITVVEGGSETVLTIDDRGIQQGKTVTPDLQVTTLNYTRSLNASSANAYTVCLPYAPSTDANLKYYTLTGCEGTTLLFDEISGAPQAYTPYLVFASSTTDIGTENLKQTITMSQTVSNSSSAGNYVMKGTLSGFSHEQSVGKYILQSGNRWGQVDGDPNAYIPPFRAYIEATTNGARMLDSSFGGEATGINSLRTIDRDGTERYFDLNGRRIENPKKAGVYIRNGRKEVMK